MAVFLRLFFWFAIVLLLPASWVHQHGWLVHRTIPRSTILARHGFAYEATVPSNPFLTHTTDSEAQPNGSDLRLFDGTSALGPAHTPLDAVASEGHGVFADWDNELVFSTRDNTNPQHDGRVYTATFRVYPTLKVDAVLLAACLLAALLASEVMTIREMGPWRQRGLTSAQTRYAALTVVAYGVAAATALLFVGGIGVHAPLPATALSLNEAHAFVAPLSDPGAPYFQAYSDAAPSGSWSDLKVFEDGRELGPAHAPHVFIRSDGMGAYSHWGDAVFLSSSDGSDPRSNGRAYQAVYRVFLIPSIAWPILLMCVVVLATRWLPRSISERRLRRAGVPREQSSASTSEIWSRLLQPSSLVRVGSLVALYTVVLLALYSSFMARAGDPAAVKINFEYKVF